MDNNSDKGKDFKTDQDGPPLDSEVPNSARRRFTRHAVVGSAVVLSLGNRAAWGAKEIGPCLSVSIWHSITGADANDFAMSASPDHVEKAQDIYRVLNDTDRLTEVITIDNEQGGRSICVETKGVSTSNDLIDANADKEAIQVDGWLPPPE